MQRFPRGSKKVNYTLSIPPELRQNIRDRAKVLGCTEGYYLSMLVGEDLVSDLADPAREAGISIAPTTEISAQEQEQFGENLSENRAEGQIELPEAPQTPAQPAVPTMQRPRMRTIADLQREMGAAGPLAIPGSSNIRNPGTSEGAGRAAVLDPNWQQNIHSQLSSGESSESRLRKQVLENLPPESEEKDAT